MAKRKWIILIAGLLVLALIGTCCWYFATHRPESDRLPLHTSLKMTQLARKYAEEKYGDLAKGCKTECSYQNGLYEVNFKRIHKGFIEADLFYVHLEKDGTPVREVGMDPSWYETFDSKLLDGVSKHGVLSWAKEELQKKISSGEMLAYRLEDGFTLRKEDDRYYISLAYQSQREEQTEGFPKSWGFLDSLSYPLE